MADVEPDEFLPEVRSPGPETSGQQMVLPPKSTGWPDFDGWDLKMTMICPTMGNFINPKCEWCFMNAPLQCLIDIVKRNAEYWHAMDMNIALTGNEVVKELKKLAFDSMRGETLSVERLLKAIDKNGQFSMESSYGHSKTTNYHDAYEFLEALYESAPDFMTGIFGLIRTVAKPTGGSFPFGDMLYYTKPYDITFHVENKRSKYCIIKFMEFVEDHGKSAGEITTTEGTFVIPEKDDGVFKIHSLIMYNIRKEHYIALVNGERGWILYDDLKSHAYRVNPDIRILNKHVHFVILERLEKKGPRASKSEVKPTVKAETPK
jgi:hypothetical protein